MYYSGLLIFIILTILVIIIAILFTIAIDNLARLSDSPDPLKNRILDTVIGIGTFIVIFLIFLIAIGLIGAILAFYYGRLNMNNNLVYYTMITFIIFTFGLLILEFYAYRELTLYRADVGNEDIINQSNNYILWGLWLTLLTIIIGIFSIFLL